MGFGIKELIIILIIVALLFGTKKLKNIGSDLGGAIKGFKKSMDDEDNSEENASAELDKPSPLDPSKQNNKDHSETK